MIVRPMELRDLDAVLTIQAASPELARWDASSYTVVSSTDMHWVADTKNETRADDHAQVAGFLVASQVTDEMEIYTVAVRPDMRRRGVGTLLLLQAFRWGKQHGAKKAYLEVRQSNAAAWAFYKRHNFEVIGRRERYYSSPVEDGIVLAADLKNLPV